MPLQKLYNCHVLQSRCLNLLKLSYSNSLLDLETVAGTKMSLVPDCSLKKSVSEVLLVLGIFLRKINPSTPARPTRAAPPTPAPNAIELDELFGLTAGLMMFVGTVGSVVLPVPPPPADEQSDNEQPSE